MSLKTVSLTLATLALAAAGSSQAIAEQVSLSAPVSALVGTLSDSPTRLVKSLTRHLDLSENREAAVKGTLDAATPEFNIPSPTLNDLRLRILNPEDA